MKTQMDEKAKRRSSLVTRERFFFLLISLVSFFQPLYAVVPDDHENGETVEADSLRNFNNAAKIYVTGNAQLTDPENTITSPIVIVKDNKKEILEKDKGKSEEKTEERKSIKETAQKKPSVSRFYFTNPHDKEFAHFDVGLDKAVVTTTQQLKLFSINKFFVLNLMLFVSIYLVCFFKENTFFISLIGKNFQRPPPYFSIQLF